MLIFVLFYARILIEYLKYRNHKSEDEYLFCNVFGQQLVKSTCYFKLYNYNKRRGVKTTGIHRYRHTFAKQWIFLLTNRKISDII